jgi:hypothetical protein
MRAAPAGALAAGVDDERRQHGPGHRVDGAGGRRAATIVTRPCRRPSSTPSSASAAVIRCRSTAGWQSMEEGSYQGRWPFRASGPDDAVMAGNGTIGLELVDDLTTSTRCCALAEAASRPHATPAAASPGRGDGLQPDTGAPLAASLAAGEPVAVDYVASFVDEPGHAAARNVGQARPLPAARSRSRWTRPPRKCGSGRAHRHRRRCRRPPVRGAVRAARARVASSVSSGRQHRRRPARRDPRGRTPA